MSLRLGLALLALLILIGLGLYVRHVRKGAARARASAAAAQADATVSQGRAKASQDAVAILSAGAARAGKIQVIHDQNTTTLRQAPGSSDPLPAGLHGAVIGGLCEYPAYRGDPACSALRFADPAQLPPAGAAGAAPR
jgi:hypothetical protein